MWGPDLDEARAQALRSINRGLGPATPKLDLKLESVGPRFVQEVNMAFDELKVPSPVRSTSMRHCLLVHASWHRASQRSGQRCDL